MSTKGQSFDPLPRRGTDKQAPSVPAIHGAGPIRTRAAEGSTTRATYPPAANGPRAGSMITDRGSSSLPRSVYRGGRPTAAARRSLRGAAVVCAAAAALVPAIAAAAPRPLPPGSLTDRAETFVERTLHVELAHRPVVVVPELRCELAAQAMAPDSCDALSYSDRIEIEPDTAREYAQIERTRRDWYRASTLAVHEVLHRPGTTTPPALEEAVVQAITSDLVLAFWHSQGIKVGAAAMGPSAGELAVRQWSARAVRAPWTSRAARGARRYLWLASDEDRVRIYAEGWAR